MQDIIDRLDVFFLEHPTVKSAWRAAVIVTLGAVAQHFGVYEIVSEIIAQTGA